jgi:hypothetical protein
MIRAAFSHWPDTHRFRPVTEERLRKWLQAKAGHAIITTIDVSAMPTGQAVIAIAAELMQADPIHFTHATQDAFYIIASKSIDFDTLPHLAACALFDDVADVIEAETGLKVAEIMPPLSARKTDRAETFAEVPL